MDTPISEITAEQFSDLGGKPMHLLRVGEAPLELRLCEVRMLGTRGPRAAPPFSAVLCAPDGTRLDQGIHRLSHPALGELSLFIVPVGPRPEGPGFEIVFN